MSLPINRVKTIMKSTAGVDIVSKESTQVLAHAAELFVKKLAQEAVKSKKTKTLEYCDISELIARDQKYYFVREIIPNKITYKEYKKLMGAEQDAVIHVPGSSSETSSEEESSKPSTSAGRSRTTNTIKRSMKAPIMVGGRSSTNIGSLSSSRCIIAVNLSCSDLRPC